MTEKSTGPGLALKARWAGLTLTLAAVSVTLSTTAQASAPRPLAHSGTVKYTAANADPAKNRTVTGLDLTDGGAVLVDEGASSNSSAGSAVVRGGQRTVLKNIDSNGKSYSAAEAVAISDSGWIAGTSMLPFANPYPVVIDWKSSRAPMSPTCGTVSLSGCVTGDGAHTTLGTPRINKHGDIVVATSNATGGPRSYLINPATGVSSAISVPDAGDSVMATGISDALDIVGMAAAPVPGTWSFRDKAFVLSKGTTTWLATPAGATASSSTAVSASGAWITGEWTTADGVNSTSQGSIALWNQSRALTVVTGLPKDFQVSAVNDSGWIIGTAHGVGYLVRNGKATALGSLAALPSATPAGTTICAAVDINTVGQILANTCDAKGVQTGALLLTLKK